jgi:hypothetical protein
MEKISRSVHQAKQAKMLDTDCTSPYSPYGLMWQGRTGSYDRTVVTWQVSVGCWMANRKLTRVRLVANNMRTCGPIHGRHVSPICLVYIVIKILLESVGLNPRPPSTQRFHITDRPLYHMVDPWYMYMF